MKLARGILGRGGIIVIVLVLAAVAGHASASHDEPVIVVGDEGFGACGCVDEGDGTEEDPYVIRDRHIESAVMGVMFRNTTAHVVVENVTFVADNENDDWLTEAENLLEDEAFDPTAFFEASPGFTRGMYFDDVQNVEVRGFEATDPEQGTRLSSVSDARLSVDVRTTPWNGTETTYQYQGGVAADFVENVTLRGTGETTHEEENHFASSFTSPSSAARESDHPTIRVHSGTVDIGPWNATGTTGIDAAGGTVTVEELTMDDPSASMGVRSQGSTVHVTDSRLDLPRGVALGGDLSPDLTVTQSEIDTWHVTDVARIESTTIRGTPGCSVDVEGSIQASIVEGCRLRAPHVGDSLLADTEITTSFEGLTVVENTTIEGTSSALRPSSDATLRLEDTVIDGVPAAIQTRPSLQDAPEIELVDTRLVDSGLAPAPQDTMAGVTLEATNTTIDGDPLTVALDGSVTGGTHGAIVIPSGGRPAEIDDVAVGAGGLHVWGRPSLNVTDSVFDGAGFAAVTVSFVDNLTLQATEVHGPRHGLLPLDSVQNVTLDGVDFAGTGLARLPAGSLTVTDSTVGDRPIQIVRSASAVQGEIGQLLVLDAHNVTIDGAELGSASPSVLARGTNLTVTDVEASSPAKAGIHATDAALLTVQGSALDASQTPREVPGGEALERGPVDAIRTRNVDEVQVTDSQLAGPLDVHAEEILLQDVACACDHVDLDATTVDLASTRLDTDIARVIASDTSQVTNVSFAGEVGMSIQGADHSLRNLTTRTSLNGLLFEPATRFGGCDATIEGANLLASIWRVAADDCDVTAANAWWGDADGPEPHRTHEVDVSDPRQAPLNRPPALTLEAREPVVEDEVATLSATVDDDWWGSGPVAWDLPATELVGRTVHPVFADPGPTEVAAASTDGFGATGAASLPVTVHDRPDIQLTWEPDVVRVDHEVQLEALVDDLDGVDAVSIDVGADGTTEATGPTLNWTFPEAGDWLVGIHAEDEAGLSSSVVDVVPVEAGDNEPPRVTANATVADPVAPASVELELDATSTDDAIDTWRILVDDAVHQQGTGSPPSTLSVDLDDHGLRSLAIEVVDEHGARGSDNLTVPIEAASPELAVDDVRVDLFPVESPVAGEEPILRYTIEDPDSQELTTEVCLSGELTWCRSRSEAAGANEIALPSLPAGNLRLDLSVLDEAGNQATASQEWVVEANDAPALELAVTQTNGSSPIEPDAEIEDPEGRSLEIEWFTPWGTHGTPTPEVRPEQRGVFPLHVQAEDPSGAATSATTLLVVDDELDAGMETKGARNAFDPIRVVLETEWIDGTGPSNGVAHVQATWNGVAVASETIDVDGAVTATLLEPDTGVWPPGDLTVDAQIRSPSPPGDPIRDIETAHLVQEVDR